MDKYSQELNHKDESGIETAQVGGIEPYNPEKYRHNIEALSRKIKDKKFPAVFKVLDPNLVFSVSKGWTEDKEIKYKIVEHKDLELEALFETIKNIETVYTKILSRIGEIRKWKTNEELTDSIASMIGVGAVSSVGGMFLGGSIVSAITGIAVYFSSWMIVPPSVMTLAAPFLGVSYNHLKQGIASIAKEKLQGSVDTIDGGAISLEKLTDVTSQAIKKINSMNTYPVDHTLWQQMKALRHLLKNLLKIVKELELRESKASIPYLDLDEGKSYAQEYAWGINWLNQHLSKCTGTKEIIIDAPNLGEILEFLVRNLRESD